MEDRDWEILTTLNEYKNMTRASRELFISQPALTNRLKQMETEFRVKIVNRSSKGVHFTPEGEYLVAYAQEMLQKLRTAKENIFNLNENFKGTLRIGTSRSFGKYNLSQLLRNFMEHYPEVDFRIITDWSTNVHNLVQKQDVHLGFVRREYPWLGHKDFLFEDRMCIASKHEINLADLPNLPRIVYQTENATKLMIDEWWLEQYSQPPLIVAEVDTVDTCKEMILNGLGYSFLSSKMVLPGESIHTVDIAMKNGDPIRRRTWIIYHEESLNLNIVRAFVNFAKEYSYYK